MDQEKKASRSVCIQLPAIEEKYKELLNGSSNSVNMRSGCVVLDPGESVGLHSTEDSEEMVVTLSGHGELHSPGCDTLQIHPGCVLYNPPHTPHDVINTGDQPLRYIYIVAAVH